MVTKTVTKSSGFSLNREDSVTCGNLLAHCSLTEFLKVFVSFLHDNKHEENLSDSLPHTASAKILSAQHPGRAYGKVWRQRTGNRRSKICDARNQERQTSDLNLKLGLACEAQNFHSSLLTSPGYGFGGFDIPRVSPECICFVPPLLPKS